MKPLREYPATPLAWVQPAALNHAYELRAADVVCAKLDWTKGLGSPASATSASGSWSVAREGFVRPRVAIRAADAKDDAAFFEPGWLGGGDLTLAGGARLHLVPANLWRSEWRLAAPKGPPLLRLMPDTGLVRTTARLEITPEGAKMPELEPLVLLTWSVLVLMEDDLAVFGV